MSYYKQNYDNRPSGQPVLGSHSDRVLLEHKSNALPLGTNSNQTASVWSCLRKEENSSNSGRAVKTFDIFRKGT
jgi:hypothetical protein